MNSSRSKGRSSRSGKSRRGLGAALVAVAALATLGAGTAQAQAATPQVYVALGDSMASGPLVPPITGPLACGRSTRNYAHLLADQLKVTTFHDVTCSGADTGDMAAPQKLSLLGVDMGTAAPQFDALSADTTLVTLTIGGNDAGLVGVAQDCMQLDPTADSCQKKFVVDGVDKVSQKIEAFGPKLAAVLDTVHQRSPQARVLVTGYGDYIKKGGCWPIVPVLGKDADWLQGGVDHLNSVIAAQSAAHGAEYVDVRTPSAGHDACRAVGTKWVEGFVPTAPAAPLHPNALGEAAYARFIGAHIGG
ncbi:SGNH/GDSL hydrolase family protein [Streptomyces sp. NPDC046716]|uniref:SGNH/GDSL hydrolase family protein n=1 Tax=Streptomyces sp. NPDC046716 TaxID=3157093 RepID=UPI0033D58ACB